MKKSHFTKEIFFPVPKGLLKQAVATDGPMNEEELISSLYQNWEILTQEENLQNLIDSTREIY